MTQRNVLPPYINGRFVDIQKPEGTYACQNPARPNDILAFMGWTRESIDDVILGMKAAQSAHRELQLEERLRSVDKLVASLRENAEELKSQMMLELSRSRVTVEQEWRLCESLFERLPKFCEEHLSEHTNSRGWKWDLSPVGLVLVSSTVALPVYTILSSLLPALAAGNAVTIKPSSHCPLSSSLLASCVHQAQLPAGLVQVVYGDFEVFRRLILTHEFDVVLYTGGEENREQIRKDLFGHDKTKLVLCSIGKNAAVVMPSCDMAETVSKILYGMCADAGQRIEATSLVFVHSAIAELFTDEFVKAVKEMPIGAKDDLGDGKRHVMGPLCSVEARERFLRFQGIAYRESAETLRWGKSIDNMGNGFFVSPGVHLVAAEKVAKSVYACTPFFGPDVAIVPVADLSESIALIEAVKAGHVVSVYSQSEEEALEVRRCTQVPQVYWNCPTTDLDPEVPLFGRGYPNQSMPQGMSFLFSTVFSKVFGSMGRNVRQTLFALLVAAGLSVALPFEARADYQSSVEGNEVVKGKFYPKQGRIQLNLLQGGSILNQSFVDTYLYTAQATYHINEWHAISVDFHMGFNIDRDERKCVENFYYRESRSAAARQADGLDPSQNCDPDNVTDPTKPGTNETRPIDVEDGKAWTDEQAARGPYQRKPAYMPIREIKQMYGLNYQWTPVYGKALWFLSAVGYLDFFMNAGAGIAMSDYYPRQSQTICYSQATNPGSEVTSCDIKAVGTSHPKGYGKRGRPVAESQTSPLVSFGLGSRFYMGRVPGRNPDSSVALFLGNLELRNYTVVGSAPSGDSGMMNFFALWGGLGMAF
jgi:acyl-CoA reductase-like NAD-dependent aldehyde dehydrogenase